MNFDRSESQKMISESVKAFANQHILPNYRKWDNEMIFPIELFKKLGKQGLMGVLVPEELGGSGLSYFEYIDIIVELSKIDPSIGLSVAAHNSLCTDHILRFGNEEQKKKWIPKLASGARIGAWGLTEHNTGSDAGGMATTAVKEGNDWIINGAKNFITHAISGDVAVVIVRTGEKGDSHGMTAFVIEKGTPGFSSGQKLDKLGMRASETSELLLDNVRIPDTNRLGNVGEGFVQAMKILDGGRISIGALSLGIAKGAYEASLKYSKEREQFGKPIGQFQAIGFKLADMLTKIAAAELLLYKAAHLKEKGERMTNEGAIAKMYASEIAVEIATDAVQIHGGYGYTKDFPVEKFYRDSKLCTIGEGTTEIQKLVISRNIMKS